MGLARFYVPSGVHPGEITLDETESHHAARVLRLQVGEDVLVFDGRGNEGFGTIQAIDRRRVSVQIANTRFAPRDHDGRIALAIAMPKGDRQRSVMEKLVELGVDHLIPIETERSVAKLDSDGLVRLERYMIEACKQSMRNRCLTIHPPCTLRELLVSPVWQHASRWFLHPGAHGKTPEALLAPASASDIQPNATQTQILFAIGPEGGFAEQEANDARSHGFELLDLGERILRVETAVAYASVLGHLRVTI
ncbi:MAG: 16S rRNA (uracil(1498)-N(3))-methyltransferase [Pirellula sp.]|jgi:16S rRNA (uracil1498-N3)-methyltransferase|nr:16S rRNA (uracil(1498)-N(3))-methyltransferase [Pirellula sp.]